MKRSRLSYLFRPLFLNIFSFKSFKIVFLSSDIFHIFFFCVKRFSPIFFLNIYLSILNSGASAWVPLWGCLLVTNSWLMLVVSRAHLSPGLFFVFSFPIFSLVSIHVRLSTPICWRTKFLQGVCKLCFLLLLLLSEAKKVREWHQCFSSFFNSCAIVRKCFLKRRPATPHYVRCKRKGCSHHLVERNWICLHLVFLLRRPISAIIFFFGGKTTRIISSWLWRWMWK